MKKNKDFVLKISVVITVLAALMSVLTSCAVSPINRFKQAIEDGYYRTAQSVYDETTDPQFFDEAEQYLQDKADEAISSYARGDTSYMDTSKLLSNFASYINMAEYKYALETISESKKFYFNAKEAEKEQDYPFAVQYYSDVSSLDTENYSDAQQSIKRIKTDLSNEIISELNKYKNNADIDGTYNYIYEISERFDWSEDDFKQFFGEDVYREGLDIIYETKKLYDIKEVEDKIKNIGSVNLNSSNAIKTARTYYDSSDAEIQNRVSNYNTLVEAEAKLRQLQIEDIEKAISSIGTVTLSSAAQITNARRVYNSYPAEIKNSVNNYDVLTAAEKKIEELQINDVLKFAEEYAKKGDYSNAIKSLDTSIRKYGSNTTLTSKRATYVDSYAKEAINSAAEKYKPYDYNALMAAEKIIETALKVLPDEKQLKNEMAYYKSLEPIPLTEVECNYNTGGWGERYCFRGCGRQASVSGYIYDYTLAPEEFEKVGGEIGATYPYGMAEQYFSNYQYSKLTGKLFFNEKYKNATSAKAYLLITFSSEKNRFFFNNDGKTHSFELDLTGVKEFVIQYGQTEEMNDLAFLADVYLWK